MKNTFKMKNTFYLIGIIALSAVIGFTMAACATQPKHTHTGEWVIVTPAGEHTDGEQTRICSNCGEISIESIPQTTTPGLEYYEIEDGNYGVNIGSADAKVIVIASEYEGKPVTEISGWGFSPWVSSAVCETITSVEIPNSVTKIGSGAFAGCGSLISVTIPNSVTYIGEWAFGWSAVKNITIPASVSYIGEGAFAIEGINVTVLAVTPPTHGGDTDDPPNGVFPIFDNPDNVNLKIYVPVGSVNAYKTKTGWSVYAAKITAMQ